VGGARRRGRHAGEPVLQIVGLGRAHGQRVVVDEGHLADEG
jgi:hypothetical protein